MFVNLVCTLTANSCSFVAGEDFGPSQNYTVTFPAGSTRQSVDIPIINDTVLEPDETFSLEISVPEAAVTAGIIGSCDPIVATEIIDDDGKFYINNTITLL